MDKENKTAYEIAEETYEEIKKEIEGRKKDAEEKGIRYYTPFAIGQEADEIPARPELGDLLAQTLYTWYSSGPRLYAFIQHYMFGAGSRFGGNACIYYDAAQFFQFERGRYNLRIGELVIPILSTYNYSNRSLLELARAEFHTKEELENATKYVVSLIVLLIDIYGKAFFEGKVFPSGFRSFLMCPPHMSSAVRLHEAATDRYFLLWEGLRWKKADIKKIKANIHIAKNPTLIRAKKAEIKKIKADNWIYRPLRRVRWLRQDYREIRELEEEIKRLKEEGRGKERIEEIEEPKEYESRRPYHERERRYLYPQRVNREKVKLKSVAECKEDIRKLKEDIKKMKAEKKAELKEMKKRGLKWLKKYREEYKNQIREHDKRPEDKEWIRRWRVRKKWIFEKSKKYNLQYQVAGHKTYAMGAFARTGDPEKEEINKVLSELYVPTKTAFERETFEEIRGDPRRENTLPSMAIRKWRNIDAARFLGNYKGYGLGRLIRPGLLSEIICKHSRYSHGFNELVYKVSKYNKGIGEWKELPVEVLKKIPYPLVFRPIKDKHGYTVLETDITYGLHGRWECRPLHPSDAFHPWNTNLSFRILSTIGWLLSKIIIKHRYPYFCSGGRYWRWPFDYEMLPHFWLTRLAVYLLLRI